MSFLYRDETKELNDLTRKEESGSFIQLQLLLLIYLLDRDSAILVLRKQLDSLRQGVPFTPLNDSPRFQLGCEQQEENETEEGGG